MKAEDFIFERYNNCEKVVSSHGYKLYYDQIYLRQCKLHAIDGLEKPKFEITDHSHLMFEIHTSYQTIFVDFGNIINILIEKFNINEYNIEKCIRNVIKDYSDYYISYAYFG